MIVKIIPLNVGDPNFQEITDAENVSVYRTDGIERPKDATFLVGDIVIHTKTGSNSIILPANKRYMVNITESK